MVALLQRALGSAVRQPVLLHVVAVRLEQDVGAAKVPDLLLRALDHAVALARLGVNHFSAAGHLEALLGAGLGLHLGHLLSSRRMEDRAPEAPIAPVRLRFRPATAALISRAGRRKRGVWQKS